ncbi:hypothetical protein [Streptomyces sp. NPDC090021]|uniref:hypothetical protein n=1 Tax=Streptomyces sp. NPDC090021 TaxID=3365919 RepID=UPI0037FF36AC
MPRSGDPENGGGFGFGIVEELTSSVTVRSHTVGKSVPGRLAPETIAGRLTRAGPGASPVRAGLAAGELAVVAARHELPDQRVRTHPSPTRTGPTARPGRGSGRDGRATTTLRC